MNRQNEAGNNPPSRLVNEIADIIAAEGKLSGNEFGQHNVIDILHVFFTSCASPDGTRRAGMMSVMWSEFTANSHQWLLIRSGEKFRYITVSRWNINSRI